MQNTLNLMRTITTPEAQTMSWTELASQYQSNYNPSYLAETFVRTYAFILQLSSHFFGINDADIASWSMEKIDYCLQTYNPESGVAFTTYLGVVLKNKFREETQSLSTQKRKLNLGCQSLDFLQESGFTVASRNNVDSEIVDLLETTDKTLTEAEKIYCRMIMENYSSKEIARVLGVSIMTISNMKKRVQVKLSPLYNLS